MSIVATANSKTKLVCQCATLVPVISIVQAGSQNAIYARQTQMEVSEIVTSQTAHATRALLAQTGKIARHVLLGRSKTSPEVVIVKTAARRHFKAKRGARCAWHAPTANGHIKQPTCAKLATEPTQVVMDSKTGQNASATRVFLHSFLLTMRNNPLIVNPVVREHTKPLWDTISAVTNVASEVTQMSKI